MSIKKSVISGFIVSIVAFGLFKVITTNKIVFKLNELIKTINPVAILNSNYNPVFSIREKELFDLTNSERKRVGIAVLLRNTSLNKAAELKINDMIAKNYWSHIAPDGTDSWIFFHKVGYSYLYAGENLAKDYSSSKLNMYDWMNSEKHKSNILNEKYTEIGIASKMGKINGENVYIIVQLFGTPMRSINDTSPLANVIDRQTVLDYLESIKISRESWLTNSNKYSKDDLNFILDNFDNRIQICNQIIYNIDLSNVSDIENLSLWNEVVKLSNDATERIKQITIGWEM